MLGIALGLATLSGVNLYLTVLATGLAVRFDMVRLDPVYQQLDILADPVILVIAGLLFLIEFLADKIPWIDSAWDSIHTVIRPVGGAFLAVQVLGTTHPVFDVVIALLGGGVSLGAHTVKAGTRLLVNTSPEPFSNIGVSLVEDAGVVGGVALIVRHPVASLVLVALFLALLVHFAPLFARTVLMKARMLWNGIAAPAAEPDVGALPRFLPPDHHMALSEQNLFGDRLAWAVPCYTGRVPGVARNLGGYLVAMEEDPERLYFVAPRRIARGVRVLELVGYRACHQSRLLCETLTLYALAHKPKYVFLFLRSQSGLARAIERDLQRRLDGAPGGAVPSDRPAA